MISEFSKDNFDKYIKLLKSIGALSRLFSKNTTPYLNYRISENIFCKSFNAVNVSRSDIALDAKIKNTGYGIKTFISEREMSLEKIAEFNNKRPEYMKHEEKPDKLINEIANLRNERLKFAKNILEVDDIIYHYITREKNAFNVVEDSMIPINYDKIEINKSDEKSIHFNDNKNDYSFVFSKSTLYKRFYTINPVKINIDIMEDPFEIIKKLYYNHSNFIDKKINYQSVYLPLYSHRGGFNVPKKSGLNQWNAGGRSRHPREVYIRIPKWIHRKFPSFFPNRNKSFKLILPSGKNLNAKVCQQDKKALMSNPNKALGEWLLGKVLNMNEKELVTYEMLMRKGVDCVLITKEDNNNFHIDFKSIGAFELFKQKYNK
ncbi:MAG: NgoFVII family restriction endonuclease [Candidatus Mcinerneyibacterium aminivorans]|uniref:NgoFVII family restriction endonuclease n=1 Tax=Candidatus Mcinerneyibacterium aminivorans TaxID=2703815 RepID=A0A5D0MKA7_9BACT|nr:MAG: NgoFVII family restriction endonuclease [Candidatus Mcinerneyibacterium aminivorans]